MKSLSAWVICCATLLLSACVSNPSAPDVVEHTTVVTATTKVVQPCVAAADVPTRLPPTPVDKEKADEEQLAAALDADMINLRDYAAALEAQMAKCVNGATK